MRAAGKSAGQFPYLLLNELSGGRSKLIHPLNADEIVPVDRPCIGGAGVLAHEDGGDPYAALPQRPHLLRRVRNACRAVIAAAEGALTGGEDAADVRVTLPGGYGVRLLLHLEQGAVLKAYEDIATYFHPNGVEAGKASVSGAAAVDRPITLKPSYAFIYAKDADSFSITGQGAIDGNVYAFMKRVSPYYFNGDFYPRPTMCYVEHCNHITFTGITMQNSLAVR